jgi:glutamyl-Q tRNA(Asp) synthetase
VQPGDEAAAVAARDAARFLGLDLDAELGPQAAKAGASLAAFWQAAVPAWGKLLAAREAQAASPYGELA